VPARPFDFRIAVPFGILGVRLDGRDIDEIVFLPRTQPPLPATTALGRSIARQLLDYVDDPRAVFDLPLAVRGTAFQRRVWQCISAIPCGGTRTYGDIARELSSSARAVGQACGENPFPLVVPCHRVVAAAGLGGFAHRDQGFTLGVKRWLLAHEAAIRELLA
jgi:methylated-DNA-[protein]-cysteine S-methyltransferase